MLEKPCKQTLTNYKAMLATIEGILVKSSTIDKLVKREIAENSYCALACHICVIVTTYFLPGQQEDAEAMKKMDKATVGAKLLFKYAMKAIRKDLPITFVMP